MFHFGQHRKAEFWQEMMFNVETWNRDPHTDKHDLLHSSKIKAYILSHKDEAIEKEVKDLKDK